MKTVSISQSSFLFRYLRFITFNPPVYELPKDTCGLRRNLIVYTLLALFTLPIMLLFHLLLFIAKEDGDGEHRVIYVVAALFQALSVAIGVGMLPKSAFLVAYGVGLGTLLLGGFIVGIFIVSVGALITYITRQIRLQRSRKQALYPTKVAKPSVIGELWRSLKDKVCFRIDYN